MSREGKCHVCGEPQRITVIDWDGGELLGVRTAAVLHCRACPEHDVAGSALGAILAERDRRTVEQWRQDDAYPWASEKRSG